MVAFRQAHGEVPLDLPHAGTVAARIRRLLVPPQGPLSDEDLVVWLLDDLVQLLTPPRVMGENPGPELAEEMRQEAARLGRALVTHVEVRSLGSDRLGQCVRNLFECLAMAEEGAVLSLRAGERPDSPQRPR